MKQIFLSLGLIAFGVTAHASCFAEYKAKQDNPLKLHYGVAELDTSTCADHSLATQRLETRLAQGEWTLLNLLSLSTAQPTAQQETNAGSFFLRF